MIVKNLPGSSLLKIKVKTKLTKNCIFSVPGKNISENSTSTGETEVEMK